MNKFNLNILSVFLFIPIHTYAMEWRNECVGYYQFNLPLGIEAALYVQENFTNPPKQPISDGKILIQRTKPPVITFGKAVRENGDDLVQAQFSEFLYRDYKIEISTKSDNEVDFSAYKNKVKSDFDFRGDSARKIQKRRFDLFKDPIMSKEEFERVYGFIIKDYPQAFSFYEDRGYSLFINGGKILFNFKKNMIVGPVMNIKPQKISGIKKSQKLILY